MEGETHNFERVIRIVKHLKSESFEPLIVWRERLCLGKDTSLFEKVVVKSFKTDWNLNDFQMFCDTLGILIQVDSKKVFIDFNSFKSSCKTSQKKMNLLFSRRRNNKKINNKANKIDDMPNKISELYNNLQKVHNIQKLLVEALNTQKMQLNQE